MSGRDRTVGMYRIRNEGRWIYRSLERTFQVAKTVVLLDDGSDDNTLAEVTRVYYEGTRGREDRASIGIGDTWGMEYRWESEFGPCVVMFVHSPFRPAARPKMAVSEIRDKQVLWEIVKARVDFDHVLCLDGDEMLSRRFVVDFPTMCQWMEDGITSITPPVDVFTVPFIYLWDGEQQRRKDGIYGDDVVDGRIIPHFRVPRLFTVKRLTEQQLFDMRFAWEGSKGGFHCGSIPRESFRPLGMDPVGGTADASIVHFGYIDESLRQAKFHFYREIDPGNLFEGEYLHIIGKPDQHAPGPVEIVPWSEDA